MATTLKDVARIARVSVKTVSNVIHDHPHVSDEVRRRVETAIRQLGYRPNLAARGLRRGRSGLLTLVAPHAPGVVEAIVSGATALGFRVVLAPPDASLAEGPDVDAVLVSREAPASGRLDALAPAGTPLVLLTGIPDPRYDCVGPDTVQSVRDAFGHLTLAGRRRVAAVGSNGFREAVRRAWPTPPAGRLSLASGSGPAEGYRAVRWLVTGGQPPDAILCGSDLPAAAVIRAVADEGLRVPEDVAVIAIGDGEAGRYLRPAVTTVATDPAFIAGHALGLVVRRLGDRAAPPVQIVAPHVVLTRESTRPLRLSTQVPRML
ncbi:LacI family transcriptional regulator [Paractinoplanes deccanensis]|uniref:LacI family transcriptional regulator n=1 Tax=Paractinoplanes deccanensis TaxID=113561 RepID=A0ABQ3XY34_9ACTN|nr:LacI family DNA-binding transcriptional regulator [Actinoplanes deccanensis]GID72658.1 LacI family transcriptional regulator [Actinoplanes deccanensis]